MTALRIRPPRRYGHASDAKQRNPSRTSLCGWARISKYKICGIGNIRKTAVAHTHTRRMGYEGTLIQGAKHTNGGLMVVGVVSPVRLRNYVHHFPVVWYWTFHVESGMEEPRSSGHTEKCVLQRMFRWRKGCREKDAGSGRQTGHEMHTALMWMGQNHEFQNYAGH
jgi:hypothetical protein